MSDFVYFGMVLTDPAMMLKALVDSIQTNMDGKARLYGYDDVKTAITYRGDPNPRFAAEAEGFFQLRSATWTTAYGILAEVQAGTRTFPSIEEAIAMMPDLVITYPQ